MSIRYSFCTPNSPPKISIHSAWMGLLALLGIPPEGLMLLSSSPITKPKPTIPELAKKKKASVSES